MISELRERRRQQLHELFHLIRHHDSSGSCVFYYDEDKTLYEGLEAFLARYDIETKYVTFYLRYGGR